MIKFVRVIKHPDHYECTWFRLFIDGELVTSFEVPDECADKLECGLNEVTAALRHASGSYHEGEPVLSAAEVRAECYRARRALEEIDDRLSST